MKQVIEHPTRDACLYLVERGERVGRPAPPAPAYSIAYIARQSLGGFSSNLAHVCSSLVFQRCVLVRMIT